MIEHIKIIGSIFVALASIFPLYSSYLKRLKSPTRVVHLVFYQILALFIVNLIYILVKYLGNNVFPEGSEVDLGFRNLFFRMAILGISIYYIYMLILLRKLIYGSFYDPIGKIPFYFICVVVLLVGLSYVTKQPEANLFINSIQKYFAVFIFLSEPLIFIVVLLIPDWYKNNHHKKLIRSFILLHSGKYILLILFGIILLLFKETGPIESISYLLLILFYMIPPYLWLLKFLEYVPGYDLEVDRNFLTNLATEFGLTLRETEITGFIYSGYSNKEIEHRLSISYSTVKNHLYNIYRKIGIYSRLELSAFMNQRLRDL